jgi:hypothetical protein
MHTQSRGGALRRLAALEAAIQPDGEQEMVLCLVIRREYWEALGGGDAAPSLVMRQGRTPDDLVIMAPRRR